MIDTESDPGAWGDALRFTTQAFDEQARREQLAAEINAALAARKAKRPANHARSIKSAATRRISPEAASAPKKSGSLSLERTHRGNAGPHSPGYFNRTV